MTSSFRRSRSPRPTLDQALKTAPVGGVANITYTQQDAIKAIAANSQK